MDTELGKQSEVEVKSELPEGEFQFKSNGERGIARIDHKDGKLAAVLTAPMEGVFEGGERVTRQTPDGKTENVLEISLQALSPESTQGAALMHLQLDGPTISALVAKAAEQGILETEVKSKWAKGGKMDQLTNFALDLDKRLGQ